jgi:hypothetical protein
MSRSKRLRMILFVTAIGVGVCAPPAGAAPVSVVGTISSFSGPVAYPPDSPQTVGFGPSLLNGFQVVPDTPSSRAGVGLVSFDFAPGTSVVDFYNEGDRQSERNRLEFIPATVENAVVGQEYLIGTFKLQNGVWFGGLGEGDSLFAFSATTVSADPALDGHTFSDVLRYRITQFAAGNTPEQNADFFYFDRRPELGTMSVYERSDSPTGSNQGTIDLYARIGSLIPTRLANPGGGAFIAAVPEPESYAMLLAGLGLLGWVVHRRKHQGA